MENPTGHTCLLTSDTVPLRMLASELELHLTEELCYSSSQVQMRPCSQVLHSCATQELAEIHALQQ